MCFSERHGGFTNDIIAHGDGNYLSSAVIILRGNAHLEMTSGSIADNNSYQGSAGMMYSPDSSQNARGTFLMAGGEIQNNASSKLGKRTPSGAVHVEGNAAFTMSGVAISGNSAADDGKGGGVCVVDPGIQGNGTPMDTAFTMKAADGARTRSTATVGTISGNTAFAGGGIYSYSDSVVLSAGTIEGNTAWNMGGGIGANGGIVIGKDEKCQIPVKEVWDHGTNPESSRPAAVTVNLKNGETVIDSMPLTADCDWKGVFTELSVGGNYSVEEVAVPQYSTEVSGSANDGFVIKNTFVPADPEPGVTPAPEPGTPSSPEPGSSEGDQGSAGDTGENGSQLTRTGDSTNIYLWLALATVSALAICGTCALSRASRSRETRGASTE